MMTYSIGVERKLWPSDGGLSGNASTPGIAANFGRSSSAICCCFRVRSSHGLRRSTALPSTTVGKPEIAVYACGFGNLLVELLDRLQLVRRVLRRRALRRRHEAEHHAAILDRRELRLQHREEQRADAERDDPARTTTIQRARSAAPSSAPVAVGEGRRSPPRSCCRSTSAWSRGAAAASTSSASASARRSPTPSPRRPASARTR